MSKYLRLDTLIALLTTLFAAMLMLAPYLRY